MSRGHQQIQEQLKFSLEETPMSTDTSKVEFYISSSSILKKLQLPAIETESGDICSIDGKHYLYVSEAKIEHIEFYVHEFAELIIKGIIIIEIGSLLNELSYEERAKMRKAINDAAHKLSRERRR